MSIDPDLEREYSPSSRVGGSSEPFIRDYQERSTMAAQQSGGRIQQLPGGSLLVTAVDPTAPVLVFVHGGYWQALSARDSLYLAPATLHGGWSYAAVEYTLAPHASLDTMVTEVTSALGLIAAALPDARSVVLAGHSAGGHLCAMAVLVHDPGVSVDRVVLVSGVYDLRPLVHTTVNDVLGLTPDSAEALSPMLAPVRRDARRPDVVVVVGENETDAFKAQSWAYADHVAAAGLDVVRQECIGRNHFDIVDDLSNPSTPLGSMVSGAR